MFDRLDAHFIYISAKIIYYGLVSTLALLGIVFNKFFFSLLSVLIIVLVMVLRHCIGRIGTAESGGEKFFYLKDKKL